MMSRPSGPPEHPQRALFNTLATTLAHDVERQEPPYRGPTGRDAHPKHHGCVQGTFTVLDALPMHMQRGICAELSKRFPVWVRFSNAFKRRHDLTLDARGVAIKLLNVRSPGQPATAADPAATQDFLLVSHPVFFASTAADFVDFPATVGGSGSFASFIFRLMRYFLGARPSQWRWGGLMAMLGSLKWIDDPLGIAYFSQVPYRFGEHHAKFCIRPQQPSRNLRNPRFLFQVIAYVTLSMLPIGGVRFRRSENLLRTTLLRRLSEGEVRFDFMVQIGTAAMPIDDAVVRWNERESPFVKVATIVLERLPGGFDVGEMLQFGEHLSFNPWHTLPEHEPLGSVNAARRVVYERISALRHRLNRRIEREPRAGESAADYLQSIEQPAGSSAAIV